ncbi:MAG TPA: helix-turn-helix domain-containing protein [Jiangellaceae bacterium]|nr:helix-turn-helix domain-containing protein [Jiangellaceae bacterium]
MELTLQHMVDQLADRLGRPALLEDRLLRLLAYSSHDDPVDDVREASILRRHASPEVSRWLAAFGVHRARRPVRVPGNAELHMLPRVCIPVLHKDMLLGHLWFVDADESMSAAEIDVCVAEASELAARLHRESIAHLFSATRLTDALQILLTDSPMAADAARGLVDDGDILAPDGIVAVVIRVLSAQPGPVDVEDCLNQALADSPRLLRRGEVLPLVRRDHCVLIMAAAGDDDAELRARVESLRESARSQLAASAPAATLVVGVGGHRARVDDAVESYREARMAVDAATALPGMDDTVYWARLGVDQIVVKLASMADPPVVHAGLRRLLDTPEALPLVETLETYLDVAGNAQVTAERLKLHRTSLYYRLQRVEQLAGTDLKNGTERLALHLALKVARLTGHYAPRHAAAGRPVRPFSAPPETVDHPQPIPPPPGPRLTLVRGRSVRGKAARAGLAGSLS